MFLELAFVHSVESYKKSVEQPYFIPTLCSNLSSVFIFFVNSMLSRKKFAIGGVSYMGLGGSMGLKTILCYVALAVGKYVNM